MSGAIAWKTSMILLQTVGYDPLGGSVLRCAGFIGKEIRP